MPFIAYIPAEELERIGRDRRRRGRPLQRAQQRAILAAVPHRRALQLAHPAVRARERRLPADGRAARRHRRRRARRQAVGRSGRVPRAAGHRHPDRAALRRSSGRCSRSCAAASAERSRSTRASARSPTGCGRCAAAPSASRSAAPDSTGRSTGGRTTSRMLRDEGLSARGTIVIGWAGMRGVVTLAAAQSLPKETPYYEQLVLIAFTVAIATLLLQGGTLPLVIRLDEGARQRPRRRPARAGRAARRHGGRGHRGAREPRVRAAQGAEGRLGGARTGAAGHPARLASRLGACGARGQRRRHPGFAAPAVPRPAPRGAAGGAGRAARGAVARHLPVAHPHAGAGRSSTWRRRACEQMDTGGRLD